MIKKKQKKLNIIYLLPALKGASGGAKVIYNQSSIINSFKNNISSEILHLKKNKYYKLKLSLQKKFKLNIQNYAGWDGKQMVAAKNFLPSNLWVKKKIKNKNDIIFDKNNDFIILPEIWSHFAEDLNLISKKIKYSIFVQGFYHMNSTSNFQKIKKAYENSEFIMTDSNYSIQYILNMFPKCKNKIIRVNFSIDSSKFKKKSKKNIITYMPRKLQDHSILLNFYIKNILPKGWKINPLINLNENELNKKLSESKIFLSFSNLEGIGMPPIEAALAGNIVIGYIGGGGSEYWKKPIFHKVEHGEIKKFGDIIIKLVKNYNKNWISKTKNERLKLSNQYSVKKEFNSIKFLEKKIKKLF
tara:strand:+ start:2661 stop:3731 length:1071 start_codon:yes stop_codon:yes gene_type:complete